MRLTHFFIDHPRFATVVSLFISLFGAATVLFLSVAQYPEIVPPNIQVSTVFLGATAETVAKTVATPLEQAINGVENMEYISSQSTGDGKITINVTFKIGTDPNVAQTLTRNRIQDVMSRLPEEVQRQGVQVRKTIPAYLLGFNPISPDGSRSIEYLSNYFILNVKDQLARVPGVADLFALGERQYAMRIWIDPEKAAAHDISASEILSALRSQNVQVSAGAVNAPPVAGPGAYQINIAAMGRLTTPAQFENVIIKSDNAGRITRIRDIGRAELGSADYTSLAYSDGVPSNPFWVMAVPGSNVVTVEHSVLAKFAELRKSFPSGVGDIMMYDPTSFVTRSIDEVVMTIFIAILLVVGVVYLFLQNWRTTIIPVVAIPVSLLGSFTLLGVLGTSINNLSLYGLVLAVGIVVDDAIVVVENVERNMALGMSPGEAAHQTMDEVSGALIAIALVLCAVFIPSAFISGIPGLFFKQFATTIAASTVISCFVSLTLSPALCAVLLKEHPKGEHQRSHGIKRLLDRLFGGFNAHFDRLSSKYGRVTGRLVRISAVVGAAYLGLMCLTGFQLSQMSSGFIPEQDQGYLITLVQLPPGSSLSRTDKVAREVTDIIRKTYGVEHAVATVGFDVSTFTLAPNVATVYLALPSLNGHNIPGINAAVMLDTIRKRLANVQDAKLVTISPPPVQGLGGAGGFKLMLEDRANLGPEALSRAADALVAAANKDGKTFQDVFTPFNSGSPSMYADIDREKAEKLGLTPGDIFSTLQVYMGSQYVNDFNYLGRTFQVIAQADQAYRDTPEAIGRLKVRNAQGEMVPVSSVTTLKQRTDAYRIPRYNLYPAAEVQGIPAAGVSSGTAMDRMESLAKEVLPQGITLEWTDMSFQQKKKGVPTLLVFAASALFVFLVLAAQYESWKTPLSIVLIVPMCLLPSAVGLFLRSMPIDILAQIGFVVLVGLAAKNAILIVEFARQRQEEDGVGAEEAAVHAAKTRLRPILMTSLAFILGVVPLAVATGAGAEMRQSIGTAVLFGMLGVTFFGLLFTPAFYTMVEKLGNSRSKLYSWNDLVGRSRRDNV
jgi:hydrophobe/amphiphile efflux-1 (HAE1) family protein